MPKPFEFAEGHPEVVAIDRNNEVVDFLKRTSKRCPGIGSPLKQNVAIRVSRTTTHASQRLDGRP